MGEDNEQGGIKICRITNGLGEAVEELQLGYKALMLGDVFEHAKNAHNLPLAIANGQMTRLTPVIVGHHQRRDLIRFATRQNTGFNPRIRYA